jgi:hypothetical protein
VARERLDDGLDEAPLVDGHRRREHEVLHPPGEQLDHRLEVLRGVRGVVEHHVELVPHRPEHLLERAGHLAVAVEAPCALGHRRLVAVHDRHVVALTSQLEDEAQADVAVAAQHECTHA